jgi:hypothetical protein
MYHDDGISIMDKNGKGKEKEIPQVSLNKFEKVYECKLN